MVSAWRARRYPVRAVIGVPARIEALRPVLEPLDVAVYSLDKWLLSEVVGFRVTRGVLASATRPAAADPATVLRAARRVAVLEALNDFENLGALFRNAAAFGVDAVLLDPRCADPLYRRSVRVSMGHVLRVPFAVLPDPWPDSLGRASARLHLLALTPGPGRRRRCATSCAAGALGGAARRRGPRADRGRAGRAPTSGCGSRWPAASTRSTSPPPRRWRSPS